MGIFRKIKLLCLHKLLYLFKIKVVQAEEGTLWCLFLMFQYKKSHTIV